MRRFITFLSFLALFGLVPAAFASTGAIWTTDDTCGGVNINLFQFKDDVYLNGGPQGGGGGLPDGNYYVKVTDPSGSTLLGITNGPTAVVSGGEFVICYRLVDILYSDPPTFASPGYLDTPNTGGEYKVWASMDPNFSGGTNKTDNFKVEESETGGGGGNSASISGYKFLDLNLDTEFVDEDGIAGWKIELWHFTGEGAPASCDDGTWELVDTTFTDGDGYYFFNLTNPPDEFGYYKVVEVFPDDTECGEWTATTDTCHIILFEEDSEPYEDQNFGNVCFNNGGLTMGYWKNWSGVPKASKYDDTYDQLPIILGDCLTVDTTEDAYDIFKAAKANDTGKKMLAAQLLATKLNLLKFADCDFGDAVYQGNVDGFEGMTVAEIVAGAMEVLCDENATKEEVVMYIEVLDDINNNGEGDHVLVNAEGCDVVYPEE